ncbi:hypothetical protein HYW21_04430 [Candidatus Woesearchaeota archaeon]|nr:hypothetical protein [Candidatus Woesearchaeota archaeon]
MLKFLKSLFQTKQQKEEAIPDIAIHVEDLPNWFEKQIQKHQEKLKEQVEPLLAQLPEKITAANEQFLLLQNAELQNKNIAQRAIDVMQGNRESYVKQYQLFLERLKLPQPERSQDIADFLVWFNAEINRVGTSTQKNYLVLQEFFAHESGKAMKSMKEISDIIQQINVVMAQSRMEKLHEINASIAELRERITIQHEFIVKMNLEQEALKEMEQKKEKIQLNVAKSKDAADYQMYENLITEREKVENTLKELESTINLQFSMVLPALKKYEYLNESLTLSNYLTDPLAALYTDEEVKIVNFFPKIKEDIISGAIELKDKKKEKILETIDALSKEYLLSLILQCKEKQKKRAELERKIAQNMARKNMIDAEYRLEYLQRQQEKAKEKILKLQEQVNKIDLSGNKKTLEEQISNALQLTLRILEQEKEQEKNQAEENDAMPSAATEEITKITKETMTEQKEASTNIQRLPSELQEQEEQKKTEEPKIEIVSLSN